jgi:hypothetical protein
VDTSGLEKRLTPLGERVLWALLLTPVAGSLGWVLLPILRSVITGKTYLDNNWFFIAFSFAPMMGGIIAAPVTLLVLPIVRSWLPGRDRVPLLLFAFAGLVAGFVSPLLFVLPRLMSFDVHQLVAPAMGAGSGLIVAIFYFYLTDGTSRVLLRLAVFATLSLYLVVPIGFSVWSDLHASKEPQELGTLNLDDLVTNKQLPSALRNISIDPYASAPITLFHRPHEAWLPPFEATIRVPPRLLEDFYVRWLTPGNNTPAISAMRLEALLPNLALRTQDNFNQFHSNKDKRYPHVLQDEDVLQVSVAYIAGPLPDAWFRQFVDCNRPNLEEDSAFPGLSIAPTHRPSDYGIGMWVACQSVDQLPDGHSPLIHCYKNPFTHVFDDRCTVDLVLPWRVYGTDMVTNRQPRSFHENGHGVYQSAGNGIMVSYDFPARRLSEWRRMRDLSMCLIEATVASIQEPVYPSRNAALCAEIKQAIADRKDALVESSLQ